jgi:hypothetical protein
VIGISVVQLVELLPCFADGTNWMSSFTVTCNWQADQPPELEARAPESTPMRDVPTSVPMSETRIAGAKHLHAAT